MAFPDHHCYRRAEVERLLARARQADALCVTTAKDAVRLPTELRARVVVMPVVVGMGAIRPLLGARAEGMASQARSRDIHHGMILTSRGALPRNDC